MYICVHMLCRTYIKYMLYVTDIYVCMLPLIDLNVDQDTSKGCQEQKDPTEKCTKLAVKWATHPAGNFFFFFKAFNSTDNYHSHLTQCTGSLAIC